MPAPFPHAPRALRALRSAPVAFLGAAALLLAGCTDSASPEPAPVSAIELLQPPAELLYADEVAPVRIRVVRSGGTPAPGIPVTWSGSGTFAGPAESGPDGTLTGGWTPGPGTSGTASLTFTAEGRTRTVSATLVPREAVTLEVEAPPAIRAGDPFPLIVRVRDGKGVFPSGDAGGSITLSVHDTEETKPVAGGPVAFSLAETAAGALEYRIRHTGGLEREGAILVTHAGPDALALEGTLLGREDDDALALPTMVLRDRFDNPVSGPVGAALGGGGTLEPSTLSFSGSGRATPEGWRFGTGAEAGRVTLSDGSAAAELVVEVLPRRIPQALDELGALPDWIFEGAPLPLAFRAMGAGGPVHLGAFRVWFGDELRAEGRLDEDGRTGALPLGPAPSGATELRVEVDGERFVFPLEVRTPPVPDRIEILAGDGQSAFVGTTLALLEVRVFDQHGAGIEVPLQWSATGGSVSGAGVTAPDGRAQAIWTLPGSAGAYTATVTSGSLEATFSATAAEPPPVHPVAIDGHYLVQTIQTEDHAMELVANRSALFRGFLQRVEPGSFEARLVLRHGGAVVETIPLSSALPPPATTPDRMNQSTTFQVVVPASRVTTNLSYTLEVESAAGVLSESVTPTVIPRAPLAVTFVPIRQDSLGTLGNVHPGNLSDFLGRSEALPFPSVSGSVRAEYLYLGSPVGTSSANWATLLQEIWELRTADGSGTLYYGVLDRGPGSGVAGIGYIGWPASLGIHGGNVNTAQYIFNHEVGHNLSLSHAPCGVGGDPAFPFPDGRIGAHGYFQGQVLAPEQADVMGYCWGFTFGTYHWSKAINFTVPTLAAAMGDPGPAYRIWGMVEDGELRLRSPYVGSAASAGEVPGAPRVQVVVSAPSGEILWSGSTPAARVDHADAWGFAVPVPVAALGEDRDALVIQASFQGRTAVFLSGDAEGVALPVGTRILPEAEVYRAPGGEILGFGVAGVTRAPEGALVQDGTLRGTLWSVTPEGERIRPVGRAGDFERP
jgi:hypothetical protein